MRSLIPLFLALCTSCAGPREASVTAVSQSPTAGISSAPLAPCAVVAFDLSCPPTREIERRESHDDSGALLCEAFCASEGQPHGPYQAVRFAEEVPMVTTGAYHMGRRTGPWNTTVRSADGPLRETTTYLHGPRNGPYRSYHPDGSPHVTGAYRRELEDGRWTTTSADGVVLQERTYDKGRLVGTQVSRHPNGTVASEQRYDESGRPDGAWCSWRADGTELDCTEFLDGSGTARAFDDRGELVDVLPFVDGTKHGVQRTFNGPRSTETTWSNGRQTGPQRELVGDCVTVERTLLDGRLHGPYSEYECSATGSTEVQVGTYCGGNFCGLWIQRDPATGLIVRVTEYDALSMKLAEAKFGNDKLIDFWTMDEDLRLRRAACYQAIVGGLCCDVDGNYAINTDCMPSPVDTTEL